MTDKPLVPELERAQELLDAQLAEVRGKMDKVMTPGGMTDAERHQLRRDLGAADEADARTKLRHELKRLETRQDLLDFRVQARAQRDAYMSQPLYTPRPRGA
jgi:hypothetical protein